MYTHGSAHDHPPRSIASEYSDGMARDARHDDPLLAACPSTCPHLPDEAALGVRHRFVQANGVRLNRAEGSPLPADASLFEIVNEFERRTIIERLEKCSWSQTEAAETLHVPLSTLNQKIKRLDIKIRKKSEGQ